MPRRHKQPSRRKHSSSTFEFTGEEALVAERAFKQRNPTSSRKPKISVTSISPLSTINKLLLSRPSSRIPNPTKPTTVVKEPPSKHIRTPSPTRPSHSPNPLESPPSLPSPASTPSRRSLRKRLPSFKLRASSTLHQQSSLNPVPVLVRIQDSPTSLQHTSPNAPIEGLQETLSREILLGQPQQHQIKRPREPCPDVDKDTNDAIPQEKKPRSDDDHRTATGITTNDPEETCATRSEHRSATDHRVNPSDDQSNLDSMRDPPTKLRSPVESHSERAIDVDQKDCASEGKGNKEAKHPRREISTMHPGTSNENSSTDIPDPKPSTHEKDSAVEIRVTDAQLSAKESRSGETTHPNDSKPIPEEEPSVQERPDDNKYQPTKFTTSNSDNQSESPVTPQKPDADVQVPDTPHEGMPANTQSLNVGQDEDVPCSKQDTNEKSCSILPASTESTPEKITVGPANANRTASDQELEKSNEVFLEGSVTKPPEREPISAQLDSKQTVVTKVAVMITKEQKLESDQIALGPTPVDEIRGQEERKHGARVDQKLSTSPSPPRTERKSPAKPSSGTMKRVRFTEPTPYRSSEKRLGFSGIIKMRRRRVHRPRSLDADFSDVSVVEAGTKGSHERERHLLLDELQYLLDGIFKTGKNGGRKGQMADNQVVASSLQSLVKLLLRRSKNSGQPREEGEEDNCGELVAILVEQPDLLRTIMKRLCAVLGKSRASDALLALVFVIILRATPKILLLTEHELDLLLNAFFRNSAASLKECESESQKQDDSKETMEKEPQAPRRGKLGRVFDQKKPKEDILTPLLKLMTDAVVIEEDCSAFKRETEAASHLMGIAISLVLRNELETREWMRDNRRLDKVVAVLYSCDKMMHSQPSQEEDQILESLNNIEEGPSWIVMEASLRILEFAVLDRICQQRLAHESRVSAIIFNLLKTIKSIKTGPLASEWMICAALRLCINLCHGCHVASKQLVGENGHNVVLNWLVTECLTAGLLQHDVAPEDDINIEESFDVRVLCLAVLASTVNQEMNVCNSFNEMQAEGMEKRECGAISLVLEILRAAELEAKKEESKESGDEGEDGARRRKRTTREQDAERERRAQFVMERKITIGYVCLLIGALSCDSRSNRKLIQDLLPGKSFIGVAAVLAEFLEFHHEVGVISGSMNRMYAEIIKKLVEPEAGKEVSVVETVAEDIGKDLTVDAEAKESDLDLLLESPDDKDEGLGEDEGLGADEKIEDEGLAESENAILAAPVGGPV